MNTKETFRDMSLATNYRLPSKTDLQFLDYCYLPLWVAVALFIGISVVAKHVNAESTGAVDIQHYMKSEAQKISAGKASQNPKDSLNAAATTTKQERHPVNLNTDTAFDNTKQTVKEADKTPSGVQKTKSGETQGATENVEQESKIPSTATDKESNAQSPASGSQDIDADQKTQQMSPGTDTKVENSSSGDQQAQVDPKNDPVEKPADGKGKLPFFAQADVNGDHYITKDELLNFPYLLQVFDKVDAGNDGKLEQHEYQSLKMQTKREAQIR